METLLPIAQVIASAFGAWLAIKVELRWLRKDVDRIDKLVTSYLLKSKEL